MTLVTEPMDVPCVKLGLVFYGNRAHTL